MENIEKKTMTVEELREKHQKPLSFRTPLHLKPSDNSQEANEARYNLHANMMLLNPSGFRQIRKHRRSEPVKFRINKIAEACGFVEGK